jgi:hypothetical protein
MKKIFELLKERLKENKDNYLHINDWQGDTETGFYTETDFDIEKLWEEIDEFCAEWERGEHQ